MFAVAWVWILELRIAAFLEAINTAISGSTDACSMILSILEHDCTDASNGSTWHYQGPGQRNSGDPGLQGQGHGSCSSTCQTAGSMLPGTILCPAPRSMLRLALALLVADA